MQFHWSDSDLRGQNESCEALAPYVMALFDGEASEDQARRARAHLLLCQSCAHRWLDWNRSRDLIRTADVPAPPPTLMWRVLMACRLAAFAKKTPSRIGFSAASSSARESGAPDALRAQILARTTRTQASFPVTSNVTKSRRAFPVFSLPSMAVPALALWLMVLQRDTFMATQVPTSGSFETESLARPVAFPPHDRATSAVHFSSFKKHPVQHAAPHNEAADDEAQADDQAPAPEAAHAVRESRPEPRAPHLTLARTEAPRPEADASDDDSAPTVSAPPVEAPPVSHVTPLSSPVVAPPRVRVATPDLRPAALSGTRTSPHLRTAQWEATTTRVAKLMETSSDNPQPVLVAVPSSKASTPTPAPRLADNMDGGDDSRVDEMRSVVDDFRASLAPDSSTSDADSSDDGSASG